MTLLVATTCVSFKCDGTELHWLRYADAWAAQGVQFFAALQLGHGHDERFQRLRARLDELGATVWTFAIDQGEPVITAGTRLVGICTGRNLAHQYAQANPDIEAILFIDSDILPPPDGPERLLEVDRLLVGGCVPAYCLDGPRVIVEEDPHPSDEGRHWVTKVDMIPKPLYMRTAERPFPRCADVREHWNTAGALLVRREAFRFLRWRTDLDEGLTDDPCFQYDAAAIGFGLTWVRHDTYWHHEPLGPLDGRGHDLSIIRPEGAAPCSVPTGG
jgi:hypothetical protein